MRIPTLCAVMALATGISHAQIAAAPCYESNLGTNLGLGDDQVAQNNLLGFTFPGPGGVNVTSIDISSNGFVWLGSNNDSGCCDGDLTSFLNDLPRIAAMWMDLFPPGGPSGVWFNTFAATPNAPARAVITWDQVPEFGTAAPLFTVQMQLLATGEIVLWYDAACTVAFHNALTGVSAGNGATANAIDFSAVTINAPHNSGTNPTIHEEQSGTFDLAARSFEFIPNGATGYLVFDRPTCQPASYATFGRGCPQPPTVYEFFSQAAVDVSNLAFQFIPNGAGGWVVIPTTGFFTGFTNAIQTSDDQITGPFSLPFTFAFPGGSTNAIDVDSNGAIGLIAGSLLFSRCCDGDVASFLADPPTIAVLWEDLVPTAGTDLFVDSDPANQAVHITWNNVPEFGFGGSNTCQISLFANGQFRLSYGAVANIGHDALIGFSTGNGSIDPGNIDLSAAVPFSTGSGGTPLSLTAQPGSRPVMGGPFVLELGDIAPGSVFGALVLGFGNVVPGFDLSPLGAPGCARHVTLDASISFGVPNNPTPISLTIPNDNAFLGYTIYVQGATLTPAANTLGVLTSNGGEIRVGR